MKLMEHMFQACPERSAGSRLSRLALLTLSAVLFLAAPLHAQEHTGGEASLIIHDLNQATFFGMGGHTLLTFGLIVCVLGLGFGMMIYFQLKNMPVHTSMLEVSELIYETCKTYLTTQGRFIMYLWVFIGIVIAMYFGLLVHFTLAKVAVLLPLRLTRPACLFAVRLVGL